MPALRLTESKRDGTVMTRDQQEARMFVEGGKCFFLLFEIPLLLGVRWSKHTGSLFDSVAY